MTSYLDPISIEDVPIIDKVCKECGGSDVYLQECRALWSVRRQEWVVRVEHRIRQQISNEEVSDKVWCVTCEKETWTKDKEV